MAKIASRFSFPAKRRSNSARSLIRFMPTSMRVEPGLTISAVMKPGTPIAATRMSAWRVIAPRSLVLEWQIVTVAF